MTGLRQGAAARFHTWNRRRKADWLVRFIASHNVESVLFVGSSSPVGRVPWANLVEREVAASVGKVVWSSIDPPSAAHETFVQASGLRLPFRDESFDLVVSNAVIEHVGDRDAQLQFAQEHHRVGRTWVVTTPNRWFPIESHTHAVVRHWSASWRAARPEFTRLLSRREFAELCPHVVGRPWSPTFIGVGVRSGRHVTGVES